MILLAVVFLPCVHAETRRAVVVGINEYQHKFDTPAAARRIPVKGTPSREKWVNLDGAVSDAREMRELLVQRLGFAQEKIQLLLNEQATAEAILSAIQSQLVDAAQAGDVSLFYFAGHRSQIRNTKSDEADGLDETLVPADGASGTGDIRDRELARLYRMAVEKGVRLTVILDSCHSGSGARGSFGGRGKMRRMESDTRYVEDPPDADSAGKKLAAPEDAGALILSAAQDYEPAYERVTDSGPHGLFSWAFFQALRNSPANERVDRLFQRVRAFMQSEGATQEPVMAGRGRTDLSLLGLAADSGASVTAALIVRSGGQLRLQAGSAVHLTEGCEFKRLAAGASPVRIRVSKVTGVNLSEAVVLEGDATGLQSGELFELDRWTMNETSALRLYVPPVIAEKELRRSLAELQQQAAAVGVKWISDPTEEAPAAVGQASGSATAAQWIIERPGGSKEPLQAATLRSWKPESLYVLVPPTTSPEELRAATARGNILFVDTPAKAHYVLLGRAQGNQLSYAWALPGITAADTAKAGNLPLPLRTDWVSGAAGGKLTSALASSAIALARIRSWLLITPPPSDLRFPYRLALRPEGGAEPVKNRLIPGARYKLFLEAQPEAGALSNRAVAPAWVYVFAIDRNGKGTLLFPEKGRGNVGNRLPIGSGEAAVPPKSIALTAESYDLEVSPPYGVDSYFLLVSKDALPNPDVLDFDGVRQSGRGMGSSDALSNLLSEVGEGTRGQRPAIRATWSLQRESFLTEPSKPIQ